MSNDIVGMDMGGLTGRHDGFMAWCHDAYWSRRCIYCCNTCTL